MCLCLYLKLRRYSLSAVIGVKIEELGFCEVCKLGKMTQKSHPAAVVDNKGVELLDVVVVDLAGPNRPQTLGG